jgi:hypothetical protein
MDRHSMPIPSIMVRPSMLPGDSAARPLPKEIAEENTRAIGGKEAHCQCVCTRSAGDLDFQVESI